MRKRIILITIIGLLMLMLPLMAGAEIVDSGECGEDATFILDDTGVLTIDGTGIITEHPWEKRLVREVVINEGITGIGDLVFSGSPNNWGYRLNSISIPDSVVSISETAFKDNKSVTYYEASIEDVG